MVVSPLFAVASIMCEDFVICIVICVLSSFCNHLAEVEYKDQS